jgi:hypothetical protein
MIIATGLAAGAAGASVDNGTAVALYAAGDTSVNVTLPDAVSVGRTTLPAGNYTITEVAPGELQSTFVFRNGTGNTAAVVEARKTVSPTDVDSWGASQKTEVILTPDEGGKLHLNKMFIEGDTTGYRFVDTK